MNRRAFQTWLLGVIVLATPLVFWPYLKDYTLGPKLLVWQIPLLVVLVSLQKQRHPFPNTPLVLPATVYVLIAALSLCWSTDPVAGVVELLKLGTGLATMLVVSTRKPDEIRTLACVLVISVSLSALLGILQYFDLAIWSIPSAGLPSGTLGFRNIAATVTIQTIPFAVWLFLRDDRNRMAWVTCLALLFVFLLQTRSRGAWLGCVLAVGTWFVISYRYDRLAILGRWREGLAIVVVGLVFGSFTSRTGKMGPQDIDEKKMTVADAIESVLADDGDRGRTVLWANTVDMVLDRPGGVGLGNWAIHYPAYDKGTLVTFSGAPSKPHNDYLWTASELGILGLASLLWLLAAACRCAIRGLRNPKTRDLSVAALASLIAVSVHACFSFPRDRATPTLLFWVALGVIGALSQHQTRIRLSGGAWGLSAATLLIGIALTTRVLSFESLLHNSAASERIENWSQVADYTAEALKVGRFHPEAVQLRGYALNTLGRYDESSEHYERHLPFRPNDIQVLNGAAIAYQNVGDHENAIIRYRQAKALVAAAPDLDYNLATLLIQMNRTGEAIDLLEPLVESGAPDAAILFHLGNARALRGEDRAAIRALESAVKLQPRLDQAWMILGELYYRNNHLREAIDAFTLFLNHQNGDNTYTRRARRILNTLQAESENSPR